MLVLCVRSYMQHQAFKLEAPCHSPHRGSRADTHRTLWQVARVPVGENSSPHYTNKCIYDWIKVLPVVSLSCVLCGQGRHPSAVIRRAWQVQLDLMLLSTDDDAQTQHVFDVRRMNGWKIKLMAGT